MNKDKCRRDK